MDVGGYSKNIMRFLKRMRRGRRGNDINQSKQNIRQHYDLGNPMFQIFLDKTMTYSAARFDRPGETLEQAQHNKLRSIINKAQIQTGDHVLEIGSGWGSFAIEAARQTGCRVTTVTLSQEQLVFVQQKIKQQGLEKHIAVKLCDYRKIEGRFDKIVSIEMLEAVGHKYYGTFFKTCDRLLKPNGLVVLQVITIPDQRYNNYRRTGDWIQKHIFPGGLLPSLSVLLNGMVKNSQLIVEDIENIGIHYAQTLREWRIRFLNQYDQLKKQGWGDEFKRTWEYYFSYCEAAFDSRTLGNLQIVLTRPNNINLGPGIRHAPGSLVDVQSSFRIEKQKSDLVSPNNN
jgi:cyclopropane-fatty-acyl-phospholipid synthase